MRRISEWLVHALVLPLFLSLLGSDHNGLYHGFQQRGVRSCRCSLNGLEGSTPVVSSAPARVTFCIGIGSGVLLPKFLAYLD